MIKDGNKECPYCSEEIKEDAIKCKHCKSMLDPKPIVAQTTSSQEDKHKESAKQSVILGSIGLVASIIPLATLILSGIGLAQGIKGLKTIKRKLSIVGILICIFGIFLNLLFYGAMISVIATSSRERSEVEEAQRVEAEKEERQRYQEQWYLESVNSDIAFIIDMLEILDLHINSNSIVRNDAWNNNVNVTSESIRNSANNIIKKQPPDKYKSAHLKLTEALDNLILAMDYIDKRDFNQANRYIEESEIQIESAITLFKRP